MNTLIDTKIKTILENEWIVGLLQTYVGSEIRHRPDTTPEQILAMYQISKDSLADVLRSSLQDIEKQAREEAIENTRLVILRDLYKAERLIGGELKGVLEIEDLINDSTNRLKEKK